MIMAPRPQLFFRPSETTVTIVNNFSLLPCYRPCAPHARHFLLDLPYDLHSMPRSSDPNRCLASECEPMGRSPGFISPAEKQRPNRQQPADTDVQMTDAAGDEATRLHADEVKHEIIKRYEAWLRTGKHKSDSPIAGIVEEFEVHANYPKKLYDKFIQNGRLANDWNTNGRPLKYREEIDAKITEVVRTKRKQQKKASCRYIARTLKKENKKKPSPSYSTINRHKKKMGFKVHKVQKKPRLSGAIMKQREKHAKNNIKRSETKYMKSMERKIFMDQKWFTESKGNSDVIEARPDSPIKPFLYKSQAAETASQRIKTMYLLVICAAGPIGCYKLPFREWNERTGQLTKGGKKAKGITADFMRPILQQVAKDSVKLLGPGPIDVEFDKAGAHQALVGDGSIEEIFGGKGILAPGKGPDMSPLDAGACPYMERAVDDAGAETVKEIDAAVRKAWKTVDRDMCVKIMKRVRANMANVIALRGGNFYRD